METLEQTIAALIKKHGAEAVLATVKIQAATTGDPPPGSTNPPPPKP